MDVVIIGGGIAGLSIARALEKNQLQTTLYESAPELKPVGAGIALAFNAMQACRSLGIYEEVSSKGLAIQKTLITSYNGKIISEFDNSKFLPVFGDVSQAIHRWDLQEALKNSLNTTEILLGKKVTGFIQTKKDVEIKFSDGSSTTTQYVIAADGVHSIFRQKLIVHSEPVYSGYTCWRGIGEMPASYKWREYVNESWGPGQRLGIVPLPVNRVYWFAVKNAPEKDPAMIRSKKNDLLQFFRKWEPGMLKVIEETPEENIIFSDIIDIDPVDQFAFGNILLTGDAAHATTPNMGQGGCQAIVDAAILDKCIGSTSTFEDAFRLFEQRRIDKTRRVILNSRRFGKIAQSENLFLIAIRNLLISLIPQKISAKQIMWLMEEF